MKKNNRQRQSQRMRMRTELVLITGTLCVMLTLSVGWLAFLNLTNSAESFATPTEIGGSTSLNNGEIISQFTWEHDPATIATLGPDAISISTSAHTAFGGRASTGGLCAGIPAKDIDMKIASTSIFDVDGIDVSIDFRRNEISGSFITRGKSFDFGFDKNNIIMSYRVNSVDGDFLTIEDKIDYEIPFDQSFRNYRFIYNPTTGKAEVFVNNVVIWSHEGTANTAMYWKDTDGIIIGKGVDGGGIDRPVFDNLIVRSTGSITPLAQSLLNFMLMPEGNTIKIMWSNTDNDKVEYFTIERSVNGFDFASLSTIHPDNFNTDISDYSFTDKNISNPGILYYRLRQIFKDGKFVTHPVSAIRININRELTIEKVAPTPFSTTFNMSYYLPLAGRVWVQMLDKENKIVNSDTFVAQEGKNLYIFTDKNNIPQGTYTVNIVFNDKKVSASVVKNGGGETVKR